MKGTREHAGSQQVQVDTFAMSLILETFSCRNFRDRIQLAFRASEGRWGYMIFYLQKIEMLAELNFIYDGLAKLNLNAPLDDDKAWRENLEVSQKYSYLPFDGASAISGSTPIFLTGPRPREPRFPSQAALHSTRCANA